MYYSYKLNISISIHYSYILNISISKYYSYILNISISIYYIQILNIYIYILFIYQIQLLTSCQLHSGPFTANGLGPKAQRRTGPPPGVPASRTAARPAGFRKNGPTRDGGMQYFRNPHWMLKTCFHRKKHKQNLPMVGFHI